MAQAQTEKFSAYTAVFNTIMAQLEKGVVPWRKTWVNGTPFNAVSKKPYRGINFWILSSFDYSDPRWLTMNQANSLKGKIRKGEKGTPVVFWKMFDTDDVDANGKIKQIPLLRYYTVFNVEQCEGLDIKPLDTKDNATIQSADDVLKGYVNAPTVEHGGTRACYSKEKDLVKMPTMDKFGTSEEYYHTLFHELTHSTGHAKRLARKTLVDSDGFGGTVYSEEELVAEMGAAFLCNAAGVDNDVANTAAYIAGWSKFLKDNQKVLVTAAGQAQKAADHVLGYEPKTQQEPEKVPTKTKKDNKNTTNGKPAEKPAKPKRKTTRKTSPAQAA